MLDPNHNCFTSQCEEPHFLEGEEPLPEIKCCPTDCGEDPVANKCTYNAFVSCRCGWMGPTRFTERDAIEAWNRRV